MNGGAFYPALLKLAVGLTMGDSKMLKVKPISIREREELEPIWNGVRLN